MIPPDRNITTLDADQVLATVEGIVSRTEQIIRIGAPAKLWLDGESPGPWTVSFGAPRRKDPNVPRVSWQAEVAILESSAKDATLVSVRLLSWGVIKGAMRDRASYQKFCESVSADLTAQDPSCHPLT